MKMASAAGFPVQIQMHGGTRNQLDLLVGDYNAQLSWRRMTAGKFQYCCDGAEIWNRVAITL